MVDYVNYYFELLPKKAFQISLLYNIKSA